MNKIYKGSHDTRATTEGRLVNSEMPKEIVNGINTNHDDGSICKRE